MRDELRALREGVARLLRPVHAALGRVDDPLDHLARVDVAEVCARDEMGGRLDALVDRAAGGLRRALDPVGGAVDGALRCLPAAGADVLAPSCYVVPPAH